MEGPAVEAPHEPRGGRRPEEVGRLLDLGDKAAALGAALPALRAPEARVDPHLGSSRGVARPGWLVAHPKQAVALRAGLVAEHRSPPSLAVQGYSGGGTELDVV
jgi:hypothetical protein